ncbi:Alpha/Beta hydrolase protein [Aspergillus recurvatus]
MPLHLNLNIQADRAYKLASHITESASTAILALTGYLSSFILSFTVTRLILVSILLPLYLYKFLLSLLPATIKNCIHLLVGPSGWSRLIKHSETYRSRSDALAQAQLDGSYRFKLNEVFHITRNGRGWMGAAPWANETEELEVCGAKVRYLHLRASYSSILRDGKREHRPIVFLHGNPSWSYMWRNVFPTLLERGHDVYAIDWLGHGRSDKILQQEAITTELHIHTLVKFFEATELQNAIVVAHDWGGCIALCTIPRLPAETVDSLFLLNTFFPPRLSDASLHYRLLNRIWYCTTGLLGEYLPGSMIHRILAPSLSKTDVDAFTAPYAGLPRSSKSSILRFSHSVPFLPRFALFQLWPKKAWKLIEGLTGPANWDSLNAQARLSAQDDQVRRYWGAKAAGDKGCKIAVVFGDKDPLIRDYKAVFTRSIHPDRMVSWAPRGMWIMNAGHLPMEDKAGEVAGLIARFARRER